MFRQRLISGSATILCLLLAACGGGGSSGSGALAPSTSSSSTSSVASNQGGSVGTASIQFSITVPQQQLQSATRSVQYISSATKSASITITNSGTTAPTPTIVNCSSSCATAMNAPIGQDTFAIQLYDQTGGQGNLLSSGNTTANIVAGQANNVSVTFGGSVAKVSLTTPTENLTQGAAASIPLTVIAYDASGNAIVGSQNYLAPIGLSDNDTTGSTTLSTTSLAKPGIPVTIAYNGGALPNANISASVNGSSVSSNSLALTASAPVASGSVPLHMKIYAVEPGSFHNSGAAQAQVVSDYATIAKYVDYMETDNRITPIAHAAGIKVGFYTDPVQPHGYELTWPTNAFAHDCAGNIVVPYYPPATEYEGNVGNQALVTAWQAEIQSHLQDQWGHYPQDFVRSDDSGYPDRQWNGYFAGSMSGAREPNATPYCNYSESTFLSGLQALYASAQVPVLFNGATDPSYTSYISGQSNVLGGQCETCFGGWTGSIWQQHVNTEISFVAQQKVFNSFSHGNSTPSQMIYLYASMLLGWDPKYTVLSMDIPTPSGISTMPLTTLVPLNPTATASSVSGYQQPEGVYVRQFGACYISQVSVGPCAAVVNADTVTHNYPAILSGYHHTATVTGSGIVHEFGDTGAVTATGAAPATTMPSMSAQIVFN